MPRPLFPFRLLGLIVALIAGPNPAAQAARDVTQVIDAGGYTIDFIAEPGWKVRADPEAGTVIVQLLEQSGSAVRHLVDFRILKITVPADQRTMSRDEIAEVLSKGPNSFALANLPPAQGLKRPFKKGRDLKIGTRTVATWGCADAGKTSPRTLFAEAGGTRVWLPDSFKSDGGLFLILFYEFMTADGEAPRSEGEKLESLIASIQPK
jgi:hypothetical protein